MPAARRWTLLSVFVLSSTINYLDRQTLPVAIGAILSREGSARDGTAKLLLQRASALNATAPATAAALEAIVWRWPAVFVDQELARHIDAGDLDSRLLRAAFLRRDRMRQSARD